MPVQFLPVVPALALYAGLDPGLQQDGVEGLEQVVVGAGFDAFDNAVHVLVAGDHDDRCRAPVGVFLDAAQHLAAVHPRHQQVQQHDIHIALRQHPERFLAAGGGDDDVPAARQVPGDQFAVLLLVVHGQDKSRFRPDAAVFCAGQPGAVVCGVHHRQQRGERGFDRRLGRTDIFAQHFRVAAQRGQDVHHIVRICRGTRTRGKRVQPVGGSKQVVEIVCGLLTQRIDKAGHRASQ